MNPRETICAICFLLFFEYSLCQTGCDSPAPGRCSRDNYSINSNEVCGLNAGTCIMNDTNGLCSYQQGCADPNMTHWTQVGGAAQANQTGTGTCGGEFYYSVLESPWLQFTHESSCLKFTYISTLPAALDVYLEQRGGSFLTVLDRVTKSGNNQITEMEWTVKAGTAKVIFRAYGGGGNGHVSVYNVYVHSGLCTWSGNLDLGSSSIVDVKLWTSPLLSPTEPDTVDCLQFSYQLSSSADSRLTVSVQPLGDNTTVTVCNMSAQGEGSRSRISPLQVYAPYKIVFEMEKSSITNLTGVAVTWFRRSLKAEECLRTPESAVTSDSNKVVTSSVPNQPSAAAQCSGQPLPTTVRTSTVSSTPASASLMTAEGSSHSQSQSTSAKTSPTPDDPKTSDVAAIGGGVAAVVIVVIIIAVVIIVIVVRRRRRLKKNDNNERTTAVNRGEGDGPANAAEHRDSDELPQIRTSHFNPSMPQEVNAYPEIDRATSHADVDPYELIQDGAPGKTRPSSGEDDYNHIGIPARAAPHEVVVDDDYHHIHSPHQAIPEPEDSYVYYPERGTENNAAQPVLSYTYTQVNKKRGGDRIMEVAPDSSNVYTKVNKKAKQKPGLAPKPSQPKGEGDPYNIIHRSSHPEQRGQNISERDDVDDEYNMLNFEDSRDGVVKPSGTAIGSYDHVRDAPDAYSKADGGKPHIVIDSGYDHLHLVDV